jgi:hypothetical protein
MGSVELRRSGTRPVGIGGQDVAFTERRRNWGGVHVAAAAPPVRAATRPTICRRSRVWARRPPLASSSPTR